MNARLTNARPMRARPRIRCAIYTRKSTEEGLDQAFNSLDAQHEACAAYVASQRHEGWKLVTDRYDDGGVSGATLERPAVQRLLADIDAGRVNMVVVYKIDRLTRSLADFAKLVERFDAAGCSFVSVTQAFNTSTSMGRLTLNVLLSFAQFEREVTAERIRDKVAASKKKGMWMGGMIPLGYDKNPDPKMRGLVVNAMDAESVRTIFRLYDQHACLRTVQEETVQIGIRSKRRIFASSKTYGGGILSRGQIHFLLTNPIYIGQIRHKKLTWPGQHEAIIDQDLWDRVQTKLQAASARPRVRCRQTGILTPPQARSLLAGKLRDETGDRLTPSHTTRRGRRLRYYVSNRLILARAPKDGSGWRLPAPPLEQAVARIVAGHLGACADRQAILANPSAASAAELARKAGALAERMRKGDGTALRDLIASGRVAPGELSIAMDRHAVASALDVEADDLAAEALSITAPFQTRRRGVETRIVAGEPHPSPDEVLIRRLAEADRWVAELRDGKQLSEIARRTGHSGSYIRIRVQLAFLSPRIQAAILDGSQPPDLSLERIVRTGVPLDWSEQERVFGFSA
jgi:DNA invertase Pin-like site-specific DNA recombinase